VVSIRARPTERAILQQRLSLLELPDVSIRARPTERAIHAGNGALGGVNGFQSAPAQLSGRYESLDAFNDLLEQFQSAPAQLSGRYPGDSTSFLVPQVFQSAPAQLSGRYSIPPGLPSQVQSFNPRPPN